MRQVVEVPKGFEVNACPWPGCDVQVVSGRYPGDAPMYCRVHERERAELLAEEDTGDPDPEVAP